MCGQVSFILHRSLMKLSDGGWYIASILLVMWPTVAVWTCVLIGQLRGCLAANPSLDVAVQTKGRAVLVCTKLKADAINGWGCPALKGCCCYLQTAASTGWLESCCVAVVEWMQKLPCGCDLQREHQHRLKTSCNQVDSR